MGLAKMLLGLEQGRQKILSWFQHTQNDGLAYGDGVSSSLGRMNVKPSKTMS